MTEVKNMLFQKHKKLSASTLLDLKRYIDRFFPEKKTALSTYREWLESSFRYG